MMQPRLSDDLDIGDPLHRRISDDDRHLLTEVRRGIIMLLGAVEDLLGRERTIQRPPERVSPGEQQTNR